MVRKVNIKFASALLAGVSLISCKKTVVELNSVPAETLPDASVASTSFISNQEVSVSSATDSLEVWISASGRKNTIKGSDSWGRISTLQPLSESKQSAAFVGHGGSITKKPGGAFIDDSQMPFIKLDSTGDRILSDNLIGPNAGSTADDFYRLNELTYVVVFKTQHLGSNSDILNANDRWGLRITNGKLKPFFDGSSGSIESVADVNDNRLHIATVINTGTESKIYIDGALDNNGAETFQSPNPGDNSLRIGGGYRGYIGEVVVYNSALDSTERKEVECMLKNKYSTLSLSHVCNN